MPRQGPTLRSQWLGQQLRDLRDAAGLTLGDAADCLQRDPSTMSRFETGTYPIRRPDLAALLDRYDVDETRRAQLLAFNDDVWRTGWWQAFARDQTTVMIDRSWLESRARQIRWFDTVVPGLLQTRDYAEAMIRAIDFELPEDRIAREIEFRMARQRVLAGTRLATIVDESALHRMVGGPAVMRTQLAHLLATAEQPHVEIRVLPHAAGAHAGTTGLFAIFEMPEPFPDVGYVESRIGGLYVETDEVDRLARVYDRLREVALGPAESAALILAVARGLG